MESLLWAAGFVLSVSFLSNVSPFAGASYTLFATIELSRLGFSPYTFAVLVAASAIGATAAKVAIYYGAFGLRERLLKNRNVRLIGRYSSRRSFYLVLFVTALLPVFPFDDFIYIGAGATSATIGLMAPVTLVAKLIKSAVEVALEYTILKDISSLFRVHQFELTLGLTAVFLAVGILVYRADWEAAFRRVRRSVPGGKAVTST